MTQCSERIDSVRYCRFESEFGPQYGEVVERSGHDWIERLLPPPEEDPWTRLPSASMAGVAPAGGFMAPVSDPASG